MSSVVISGDTSGAITLSAPAVAGTNTLSLPAQTATIATLTTPSFATTIGVGGATAAASGAGITFPASQSASSDANTLDDYEEGTWTPTITGTGTNPTVTYASPRTGVYTKIGRVVYFNISMEISSISGGTGDIKISLPFSVASGSEYWGWSTCYNTGLNWGANNTYVTIRMDQGAATLQFYGHRNNSGSSAIDTLALPQNSLTQIYMSGFYTA
jgi:hypothetical protein